MFSEIEQYGIFGELDEKLYASFKEKLPSSMEIPAIERDGERPAIVRGRKRPEGYVDKTIFGVWLPHGLSADPAQRHRELEAHIKRGNDIIRCYESMIGEHCQLEISIMVFDADGEESGGEFPAVRVSLAPSELRVPKTTSVKYDDESSSSSGTEFEVMPFN